MGIKRALGPPITEFAAPRIRAAYLVQTQIAGTVTPGPVGYTWELIFTRHIEYANTEQVSKQPLLHCLRHNSILLFRFSKLVIVAGG